jgi:hypothetical protein
VLGIDHEYHAQVTLKLDMVNNLVIEHNVIEFIPIKPSVAMGSTAPESYATHSRLP